MCEVCCLPIQHLLVQNQQIETPEQCVKYVDKVHHV